jgi:hypothetical protein
MELLNFVGVCPEPVIDDNERNLMLSEVGTVRNMHVYIFRKVILVLFGHNLKTTHYVIKR